MQASIHKQTSFWDRTYSVMSILGVLITVFGLLLDFLPGSNVGLSFPQLIVIISGILLCVIGLILRRATTRQYLRQHFVKNLLITAVLTLVTLVILEIIMMLASVPTRYPLTIPDNFLEPVPWWTCDESGCHYVHDEMLIACQNNEVSGRRCMVNQQGFHDSQDFVASDDMDDKLRVIMLGDSFTFGGSADLGMSFVKTLETNIPNDIIWNTGIPGAGTNQAIASLKTFAPILKPQIAILGFYMNDFGDNMFPINSYYMGVDANNFPLAIRQYKTDDLGNVIKLDRQSDLFYRYHNVDPPDNEVEHLIGTTRIGSLLLNLIETINNILGKFEGQRIGKQVDVTRQYLAELQAITNDNGIVLLVLVIPERGDLASPSTLYLSLIGLLDELKIPYLNPIDILDPTIDYAPDPDIHWNTSGHQKIGALLTACLEQFMVDQKLVCDHLVSP